ncbi:hypothetical protein DIPPA_23675 [Diplonema papillatum]|nr:hypothetical protein DIPPA_23675 [Diplonema papillatum]
MSDSVTQRRPLAPDDGGNADEASRIDPHLVIDGGVQQRWHTVNRSDGRWERIKLYDLGKPGIVYHWLNPRDPARARRRVGHLYWKALRRTILATNLLFFGIVFLIIGNVCFFTCNEIDRAWAFVVIGSLTFIPGIYATVILFLYIRCKGDYSWKDLPEPS